jgi:DNA invertase Pin-like site-specific DNA recombinase
MTANLLIPAAQYLRMSTEHQQYSLENQSIAVQRYSEAHGFEIVQTYSDPAKSGLVLTNRPGLRQLLQDVVSGKCTYRAVFVYDVSRWGRFQDSDEAAHYEFLCKSAGVPVHYCAETFTNDGSLPNLIMKALKRTMAAEYSRELSVKVLEGQKRLARLGFKQGGIPGYGLRRMLVTAAGVPKQELASGERKSIATDRVILVPGPAHEVQCVRNIYKMLVSDRLSVHAITCALIKTQVQYTGDSKWTPHVVDSILTQPKYAGYHVFGRTSSKLYTPTVRLPVSKWILTPGAFEPIVDRATFLGAQQILKSRTINQSNEELLDRLRALLAFEGRLSPKLIEDFPGVPSPSTFVHRFGGLRRAYELIGYDANFKFIASRRRIQLLREELLMRIEGMFPDRVSIVRPGLKWRSRLRLTNGSYVSVLVARSMRPWKTIHWRIVPVLHESGNVTLLARLDEGNRSFLDFHVLPDVDRPKTFNISLSDPWLNRGERLRDLNAFCTVVARADTARAATLEVGGKKEHL